MCRQCRGVDSVLRVPLSNNEPVTVAKTITLPIKVPVSQPYWLLTTPESGLFSIEEQRLIGSAENRPPIHVKISLTCEEVVLDYEIPLYYRWTDRVHGELYRPFEIRPRVTLNLEDKVCLFTDRQPREVKVKLKGNAPDLAGEIRLDGPEDWRVFPSTISFTLESKFEETVVSFMVTPPKRADEAVLTAVAEIDGEKFDRTLVEIAHPHIENQVYFPKSEIRMINLDIAKADGRIGYVMGAGDDIPDILSGLGYEIDLLTDEMIENTDFSRYQTIITGIRAYNTRNRLEHAQPGLLRYVENGGTLIIQYNVSRGLVTENIGPYPFTIGRDRVSVESAPVTFIDPGHQLLNYPNKITQQDFLGWIQERGLYFAGQWDAAYQAVLSSHDPGESDKNGGMLFARYGKGVFIYTGYSWFRQLPAGIPGAYRLFVNMISSGRYDGKTRH